MKNKTNINPQEINLTDIDRVTYVYKRDGKGQIIEVTNVSYDIKINADWITIVRYDSSHGYLHRHLVISMANLLSDTPTTIGVKKKGGHASWLTWAINDIKSQYESYRNGFLRRSKIQIIDRG
jgi:hypothetical protein